MSEKVVVALNTLIRPSNAGGSESSALSIMTNFRDAQSSDIDMYVTALPWFADEIRAYRLNPDRVIEWPWREFTPVSSAPRQRWARWVRGRLGQGSMGSRFDRVSWEINRRAFERSMPTRADIDALLDRYAIDVVHFTYPVKWPTRRPYIFEPHDIQQYHFPEFFPPDILTWRLETYTDGVENSAFVVCGTWWTKHDIMRHFNAPASKIAVIPRSSTMARAFVSPEREAVIAAEASLPDAFMYYPAMTFPHKNHLRLLEAIALLRSRRNLRLDLICTGRPYKPFHPRLVEAVNRLHLGDQVRFLGRVSEELLAVCYRRARFIVFPSLLEGHSQSLLEALYHHKPIVGSLRSSVPETIGSAGLLFDPMDVESIADALERAWTDNELLVQLAANAAGSFERYRWDRALVTFTACYKHAAGHRLSPEEQAALDRALLEDKPQDA